MSFLFSLSVGFHSYAHLHSYARHLHHVKMMCHLFHLHVPSHCLWWLWCHYGEMKRKFQIAVWFSSFDLSSLDLRWFSKHLLLIWFRCISSFASGPRNKLYIIFDEPMNSPCSCPHTSFWIPTVQASENQMWLDAIIH